MVREKGVKDRRQFSLKDWLLEGFQAPFLPGMPPEDLIRILGKPDEDLENELGFRFFNYGWFEFIFVDGCWYYFQNDHLRADCSNHAECIFFENENFILKPWLVTENQEVTLAEVKSILSEEGVRFLVRNLKGRGETAKGINLPSGFTIDFELIEGQYLLNGIRYENWDWE